MIITVFFILFVLVLSCNGATGKSKKKKNSYSALLKAAKAKGVIKLTARTYEAYVKKYARNYTLVVELTSLGGSFPCPHCRAAHDEFLLTAESLFSDSDGLDSDLFAKKPVFFAYLDYSEAMIEYFRDFQLKNVPHLAVISASTTAGLLPSSIKQKGGIVDAEEMALFVGKVLKRRFAIARPLWPKLLMGALTLLAAYVMYRALPTLLRNLWSPISAFLLSMVVFFLSMAGLVFNLIRKPAWASVDAGGNVQYVQPNARSQNVSEGVIVASLMLTCVFCHIGINEVGTARIKPWLSRASFYTLAIVYMVALSLVWQMFCHKYGFYPFSRTLPLPFSVV